MFFLISRLLFAKLCQYVLVASVHFVHFGFWVLRRGRRGHKTRGGAGGSRLTSALGLDFPEMPLSGTSTPLWGYIICHLAVGHIYAKERAFPLFILAFPVS